MATLGTRSIRAALEAVGGELRAAGEMELLIVGGAAGLLTGQFPEAWTTGDVDTLEFRPPAEVEEVLRAAAEVGRRLGLPANWLNTEAGLYGHDLPAGWQERRTLVGVFGRLRVWAIGRLDLIAMKFFAHRPIDRVHLSMMKVSPCELDFVRAYLDGKTGEDAGKAAVARAYVDAWGTQA